MKTYKFQYIDSRNQKRGIAILTLGMAGITIITMSLDFFQGNFWVPISLFILLFLVTAVYFDGKVERHASATISGDDVEIQLDGYSKKFKFTDVEKLKRPAFGKMRLKIQFLDKSSLTLISTYENEWDDPILKFMNDFEKEQKKRNKTFANNR